MRTFTHPDVFAAALRGEDWADPCEDPTRIDWAPRQAAAAIPFQVVDGRPVSPFAPTGIRYGRNEFGHWGEQRAADATVTATDKDGCRWVVMVERADGHGWALPGGYMEPGESPLMAAIRELDEETLLTLEILNAVSGFNAYDETSWQVHQARHVRDPRESDEAWIVTTLVMCHLGVLRRADFPVPAGADDAAQAAWVPADSYTMLVAHLAGTYGGKVFAAHRDLLAELLG